MNILVIGNGGRENALVWKISKSFLVDKIYCSNGNGGTSKYAKNIVLNSKEEILDFALKNKIDLTIVGPEDYLCDGIVDIFEKNNLKIFGPNKVQAQLESSKEFTKKFLKRNNIPTGDYFTFTDYNRAFNYLNKSKYPLVIKADGLCKGKGVIICENKIQAEKTIKDIFVNEKFGNEGKKIIIEEFLEGFETSLICLVSKNNIIPLEAAKDYKLIGNKDTGENTGGVGCISPNPLLSKEMEENLIEIAEKIYKGLEKENLTYTGILFIGYMITENGVKVLEFNVRFGDPETEVILPRLKSDLVEIILKTIDSNIKKEDLKWSDKTCMTTVICSKGYPSYYETNKIIKGLEEIDKSIILFHNGTRKENGNIFTNSGRVLSVTAIENTLDEARNKIYDNIGKINFDNIYYRNDIGKF